MPVQEEINALHRQFLPFVTVECTSADTICMATDASGETAVRRNESPDPSSHALNSYDAAEEDWVDEEDDDGMDYEPTTDDSEDLEFFETTEEDEEDGEYQGTGCGSRK